MKLEDLDIPTHAIKGPNPYLDRCINCNTPRTEAHEGDDGIEFLGRFLFSIIKG